MNIKLQNAFKNYFSALEELNKLGVTQNKKDFTPQLGEWLVETLYNGKRAENGIQKYWDVKVNNELIQVKTHAKSKTTSARWSSISLDEHAELNTVVIIVFSEDYKLREFYKISWTDCINNISQLKSGDVLYWDHLKAFKILIDESPKQEIIKIFFP